jgi:hypothetical protein
MYWTPPAYSDFQSFFARDFYFAQATDPNNLDFVTAGDVNRAIGEALIHFNTALYGTDAQVTNVFMYLVAFCLVRNIQLSSKGLSSQSKFPISSTSVGGVSVNYSIPEQYSKDPFLSSLTVNGYGMRFLEITVPLLYGNIFVISGGPQQ